jgi:hypothetical protein
MELRNQENQLGKALCGFPFKQIFLVIDFFCTNRICGFLWCRAVMSYNAP